MRYGHDQLNKSINIKIKLKIENLPTNKKYIKMKSWSWILFAMCNEKRELKLSKCTAE